MPPGGSRHRRVEGIDSLAQGTARRAQRREDAPMLFTVSTDIARPREAVFAMLRDLDQQPRIPLVPVLERTTPGPVDVGSRFHEVVRMTPLASAAVDSEITRLEPPRELDYRFQWRFLGTRITGWLKYHLVDLEPGRTRLTQEQVLEPHGALRLLAPWIHRSFARRLHERLVALKAAAEHRGSAAPQVVAGRFGTSCKATRSARSVRASLRPSELAEASRARPQRGRVSTNFAKAGSDLSRARPPSASIAARSPFTDLIT
jgi:uncharacterized protein YndB with AHSA1/START domain